MTTTDLLDHLRYGALAHGVDGQRITVRRYVYDAAVETFTGTEIEQQFAEHEVMATNLDWVLIRRSARDAAIVALAANIRV